MASLGKYFESVLARSTRWSLKEVRLIFNHSLNCYNILLLSPGVSKLLSRNTNTPCTPTDADERDGIEEIFSQADGEEVLLSASPANSNPLELQTVLNLST